MQKERKGISEAASNWVLANADKSAKIESIKTVKNPSYIEQQLKKLDY